MTRNRNLDYAPLARRGGIGARLRAASTSNLLVMGGTIGALLVVVPCVVLAGLLLLGSVVGAQIGARFATKFRPEYLRLGLAVMVLLVGARILLGLVWRPEEIFSVTLS